MRHSARRRKSKSAWSCTTKIIVVLALATAFFSCVLLLICERDVVASDVQWLRGKMRPNFSIARASFIQDDLEIKDQHEGIRESSARLVADHDEHITLVAGLAPNLQARYQAVLSASHGKFMCLDASRTAALNDDYCDCNDGSDETSTSACAGVSSSAGFFCRWATPDKEPHEVVRLSVLNDGICDCCGGEDEWESGVQCPDTCDLVKHIRAESKNTGYAFREKYVSEAAGLAHQAPYATWDGGPGNAFLAVAAHSCLSLQVDAKTFELCLFREIVETHDEQRIVLGRAGKWASFLWEDGSQRTDFSHFLAPDGDICIDSGKARRSEIFFECPGEVGSYAGAKFVSASQSQTPHALDASFAVDGNEKTRQGCGPSCEWIGDLGAVSRIVQIDIDFEACQCTRDGSALIEVSEDGKSWFLFSKIGGFHVWGGISKRIFEGVASARYIRIKSTTQIAEDWLAMWEISVNSRQDRLISARELEACVYEFRVSTPAACVL